MPLLVTFAFRVTVASNAQRIVLYPDAKATRPFGFPITPAPTLARTVPPRNGPVRLPRRQVPLRSAVRPGLPLRLLLPVQTQVQPLARGRLAPRAPQRRQEEEDAQPRNSALRSRRSLSACRLC